MRRVALRHNISFEQATAYISKMDRSRASYYNFYTEKTWGAAASYHLCIDSSRLGLEASAAMITDFVKAAKF
jgi:cytidylate kinase